MKIKRYLKWGPGGTQHSDKIDGPWKSVSKKTLKEAGILVLMTEHCRDEKDVLDLTAPSAAWREC